VIKIDDAPDVQLEPERTYWLSDPAIDRESSNVDLWSETASADALVIKPKEEPSLIKFRPLKEMELNLLPSFANPAQLSNRFFEAARFGLVEFEGVTLRQGSRMGRSIIAQDQADHLNEKLRAKMPFWRAVDQWFDVWVPDKDVKAGEGDDEADVGLLVWLGCQILIRSFPGR